MSHTRLSVNKQGMMKENLDLKNARVHNRLYTTPRWLIPKEKYVCKAGENILLMNDGSVYILSDVPILYKQEEVNHDKENDAFTSTYPRARKRIWYSID